MMTNEELDDAALDALCELLRGLLAWKTNVGPVLNPITDEAADAIATLTAQLAAARADALEEAAKVDGAGAWARFRHVILPQLRPAIVINLVYATIQFLKTFTVVVVMTKGGPAESTTFVSYLAYQYFDQARYGAATAMATILFAVVILLSLLAYALGERGRS
jgi:ABC-type sugar transport system permease subunit